MTTSGGEAGFTSGGEGTDDASAAPSDATPAADGPVGAGSGGVVALPGGGVTAAHLEGMYEDESPRKLKRPVLGKTRSAGEFVKSCSLKRHIAVVHISSGNEKNLTFPVIKLFLSLCVHPEGSVSPISEDLKT